jgi:hypothetical protein
MAERAPKRGPQTGLSVLKKFVDVRGLTGIDARRTAMRAVRTWQRELIADLGGDDNISRQKLTILEMATRTRLYIEHIDSWLMEQDSLINKRARKLFPIVHQRQSLCDSLTKMLTQLGLERQAKPVEDLHTYLERRGKELAEEKEKADEPEPEASANNH